MDVNGYEIKPKADLRRANLRGADLYGANLYGANLSGARLFGAKGIMSFGPVSKEGRIGYAVKHDDCIMIQLGCFWGTQDEAVAAIREKYGEGSSYEAVVTACCESLKGENR